MTNRWTVLLLVVCGACADMTDLDVETHAQEILVDPDCSPTSLQLFDQVGWHGRRICFYRDGIVDLASHCRIWLSGGGTTGCYSTWSGAVRSYKSGHDPGRFFCDTRTAYYSAFDPYTAVFTADACTQVAD